MPLRLRGELVMTDYTKLKKDTILLHAGQEHADSSMSRAVPICQTTSFLFDDTEHAARLFSLEEFGNIYTRLMNPTTDALEKRLAALEGGVGALAVASGMSAITLAILNLASAGDEIVSATNLYGGTYTLFHYTLRRLGINVKFVDPTYPDDFDNAITEKTKAVYCESIGNPKLDVADIEKISAIADKHKIPVIVDNTTCPYILQPFDYGADIVVYSTTKFIGGHGTSIGGAIVDSGKFDWTQGKFSCYTEPDPSYHGLKFYEVFGPLCYLLRARVSVLRDLGPSMSPFNAFLFLQGLETLHLRMPRHCKNALAVAEFLNGHKKVSWVNYPGLDDSSEKAKADKYLAQGAGALIGFGIKGGKKAGIKFINSVRLLSHVANIGDAKTLVIHPASTTHQQLTPEEQLSTGVTEDYIRMSVGIEHIDDIIADIDQALNNV